MIIVTTDSIPGATIDETLGLVRGSTVRTRHIGRDIMAGIRNIVGGEVSEYTKLLADAREESLQRMIENVEAMGETPWLARDSSPRPSRRVRPSSPSPNRHEKVRFSWAVELNTTQT